MTSYHSAWADDQIKKAAQISLERFDKMFTVQDLMDSSLIRDTLEEGKAEGRAEGKAATLCRLLTRRFGPVPRALEAKIAGAKEDQLDQWLNRVIDRASIEEIFAS